MHAHSFWMKRGIVSRDLVNTIIAIHSKVTLHIVSVSPLGRIPQTMIAR